MGNVPQVDLVTAQRTFAALHEAIRQGLVRACHDLSDGGLAVAAAEMAFAGHCGLSLRLADVPARDVPADGRDAVLLYAESASRFLAEVTPANRIAFEATLRAGQVPFAAIGEVNAGDRLTVSSATRGEIINLALSDLKEAWQKPLRW